MRQGSEDHQRKEHEDVEPEKVRLPRKTLIDGAAILRGGQIHEEPPIIPSFLLKRITKNIRMLPRVTVLQLASIGEYPYQPYNPSEHENEE
jgi:hypothetical protein